MHFFQSKSTKFEIYVCLLNSPYKILKNVTFKQRKLDQKAWKSAHTGFWVYWLQCTTLELCVTSTFWVMMVYCDFNRNHSQRNLVQKAWKSAHTGFWVYWSQCIMLELCVRSTFWVRMVVLDFWQEGLEIVFWNMV